MYKPTRPMAIVGIGNNLLTDDGAGIHALEQVARENTDDELECIDGGTFGLALLDRDIQKEIEKEKFSRSQ